MSTVVITGASGFVGRYLTAHLKQNGVNVIPVSRGAYPGVVQVDDYTQTPSGDVLIHLAEEPDRAKVNMLDDEAFSKASNLVKHFSGRAGQKIIYASSAVVYGNSNEQPCKVDMPVHPVDKYSELKLVNEKIVLESGGVVIRLSNLFGVGMAGSNVISDILKQIPGSNPIKIRDDQPVCDFLHVSDAVAALGLLIESGYSGILNVGSGIGTSIRTLAEILLSAANQEDRVIMSTQPSHKKSINVLDISETVRILGWHTKFTLNERLEQLLHIGLKTKND